MFRTKNNLVSHNEYETGDFAASSRHREHKTHSTREETQKAQAQVEIAVR